MTHEQPERDRLPGPSALLVDTGLDFVQGRGGRLVARSREWVAPRLQGSPACRPARESPSTPRPGGRLSSTQPLSGARKALYSTGVPFDARTEMMVEHVDAPT